MKISLRLISAILLIALSLSMLASCTTGGDTTGTTADIEDETTDDTTEKIPETTEPAETTINTNPITAEMRNHLINLCTILPTRFSERVPMGYQMSFQMLSQEIQSKIFDMNMSEYDHYYDALMDLFGQIPYDRGSIPRVYIDVDRNGSIGGKYASTSVVVVDSNDGEKYATVAAEALIKTRGNSSNEGTVHKKSYKIKFSESQTVLELGKSKTWNLISNAMDKTLIRSKLAYDFAKLAGADVPDCTFVDVYVNNRYMGNYLLTESVSSGSTKVDIKLEKGDFLLELEQNSRANEFSDPDKAFITTPYYNCHFCIKEPDLEEMTEGQKDKISDFIEAAEEALYSKDINRIKEYFNIDSFISFYIVAELFKNLDIAYSSTYFYVRNEKIYAGPIWDFDLSSGNVSIYNRNTKYNTYNNRGGLGTNTQNSYEGIWVAHFNDDILKNEQDYFHITHEIEEDEVVWMSKMFDVEAIRQKMIAKYFSLQEEICNLYEDNDLGKNRIDANIEYISESIYSNYNETDTTKAAWRVDTPCTAYEGRPLKTYEENVEFLRTWLQNRNEWLIEKFNSLKK